MTDSFPDRSFPLLRSLRSHRRRRRFFIWCASVPPHSSLMLLLLAAHKYCRHQKISSTIFYIFAVHESWKRRRKMLEKNSLSNVQCRKTISILTFHSNPSSSCFFFSNSSWLFEKRLSSYSLALSHTLCHSCSHSSSSSSSFKKAIPALSCNMIPWHLLNIHVCVCKTFNRIWLLCVHHHRTLSLFSPKRIYSKYAPRFTICLRYGSW